MKNKHWLSLKSGFSLQWHITERCNWNCSHCYRNGNYNELPIDQLYQIFLQFIQFLDTFKIPVQIARLNLTGGEIFLRDDFMAFLRKIYKYNHRYRLKILTNGSLLTDENIKVLKTLGVNAVQLSVEGLENTNDKIRGKGTFRQIVHAIELLNKNDMPVLISVTLARYSLNEIPQLVEFFAKLGIKKLGIRRMVPIGMNRKRLLDDMISPLQQRDFYRLRHNLAKENHACDSNDKQFTFNSLCCEDGIFFQEEELASQYDNHTIPLCGVLGNRILTVLPNGDVLPCRRLPIVLGNVLEKSLLEIWFSSELLSRLRDPENLSSVCRNCEYFELCRGGARCVSYGYFGRIDAPDPQCWKLSEQLPEYL